MPIKKVNFLNKNKEAKEVKMEIIPQIIS